MNTRSRTNPLDVENGMRILRPAEAWRRTGLSRSSAYRLEAAGLYPRRVKITKHASGYIAGEIEGWIEARMNERDERGVK